MNTAKIEISIQVEYKYLKKQKLLKITHDKKILNK